MGLEDKVDEMIKKHIILADIHAPNEDLQSMRVTEQFMKYFKPNKIHYLGDFMDMTSVSHWLESKRRSLEGLRLSEDYEHFNKILNRHIKNSGCKEVAFYEGNHEDWVNQLLDRQPELEGFIEVEKNLKVPKRVKKEWYKLNTFGKIGKLYLTHGLYCNLHHAKKTADAVGRSVAYGHVHDSQSHTIVSIADQKEKHTGYGLPCLCDMNPDYMKNKPNKWVNGFGVVYEDTQTGNFNLYTVHIIDGKFMFEGKMFK